MERGAPRIERRDLGRWHRDHFRRAARARASNPEAARGRGRTRGRRVGVRLPNVWQYVALELAIPNLGAVIVSMPLSLGEHEVHWVLEKTRPRLVITGDDIGAAARACPRLPQRAGSIADRGDRHELGHDRHAQARLAVGSPESK